MLKLVRGLPSIPEKFPEKGYYMLTYWLTMSDWQNIGLIDAISDAISEHLKLKIFLGEHISPDPPRYRCFYEAPSIYRPRFPLLDMSHFCPPLKNFLSETLTTVCITEWSYFNQYTACTQASFACLWWTMHGTWPRNEVSESIENEYSKKHLRYFEILASLLYY